LQGIERSCLRFFKDSKGQEDKAKVRRAGKTFLGSLKDIQIKEKLTMPYRHYTNIDDSKLVLLHSKGMSDRKIAIRMKASPTGIGRARQRLGSEPNFPPRIKEHQRDPILIYEDSKKRARNWKAGNMHMVKREFAKWQKDHRKARNKYMRKWRKRK